MAAFRAGFKLRTRRGLLHPGEHTNIQAYSRDLVYCHPGNRKPFGWADWVSRFLGSRRQDAAPFGEKAVENEIRRCEQETLGVKPT